MNALARGGARAGAGRKPAEAPKGRYQVTLRPETAAKLREAGGGNLSAGIEAISENIANMIKAHAVNPQVAVETKITDSERDVAIRECAAIARMATAPKKPGQA